MDSGCQIKLNKGAFATLVAAILLSSCAHNFTLLPRDGGTLGQGVANESDKSVTINLNGKTYTGTYVYDGSKVITNNSFGNATAYGTGGSASAFGSSHSITVAPGSGNGRVLASSPDGDTIRCEFQYSDGSGIGVCKDNAGKIYDMQIKN